MIRNVEICVLLKSDNNNNTNNTNILLSSPMHSPKSSILELTIGINSGPMIAGVVGKKFPRFRLMGDTINTASRMATTCPPGSIQLSSATYEQLTPTLFSM